MCWEGTELLVAGHEPEGGSPVQVMGDGVQPGELTGLETDWLPGRGQGLRLLPGHLFFGNVYAPREEATALAYLPSFHLLTH